MSINTIFSACLSIFQRVKYQVSCLTRLVSAKRARRQARIKNKKSTDKLSFHNSYFLILTSSFLIYFLPNAFLFTKWTRFMTPIFPFFAIFAGYALFIFLSSRPKGCARWCVPSEGIFHLVFTDRLTWKIPRLLSVARNDKIIKFVYLFICLFVITSILPGLMFMSIYAREDVRVTASRWIWQNIPDKSFILFETANVIDIPLGIPGETNPVKNYPMVSFDYYHIDDNQELFAQLINYLEKADYIIIPSRRIFANFLRLPKRYPLITKYYQSLYSGALGFDKVAQFNSFPQLPISQIGPIGLIGSDESAEESFTVFDHPVIRIYQKTKSNSPDYYRNLFN